MTKIVYNDDFGGFGLTDKGRERYKEISGNWPIYDYDLNRTDPILVQVVEEMGKEAGRDLAIREIPEGTLYYIHEYDGAESVITEDEHPWSIA